MLTHNPAWGGGTFLRAFGMAAELVRRGHEVTLSASARQPAHQPVREEHQGVVVVEAADTYSYRLRQAGFSPGDRRGRQQLFLADPGFDLVHSFEHRPAVRVTAARYRRRHGAPWICDWCDLFGMDGIAAGHRGWRRQVLGRYDQFWERRSKRQADAVTVISRELERRTRDLGTAPEHILRIPAGAPVDAIRPLDRDRMRVRHGLPAHVPIAVYSGLAAFDAESLGLSFVEIARRRPDARLLLIGADMPGFDRIVAGAGVDARVLRHPFVPQDQLGELLACGDVMLLPHTDRPVNRARYPNKLGDYLAAGRPVVTHATGEPGELVAEHGVGSVVPEAPAAFAGAVLELFADEGRRMELGRRARQLAEEELAWSALTPGLEAFYAAVVRRPGRRNTAR